MLDRICQLLRDGGMRLLASRLCHKVVSPFLEFGSAIFFELDLEAMSRPEPQSYLLFQANEDDTSRLLKASDASRTEAQIKERFRRGQLCFAAADNGGNIVHSTWCAPDRALIDELDRELLLRPCEIYVYDSYTSPAHRRHGASRALRAFMLDALRGKGYIRLMAYVRGNNICMLQAIRPSHRETGRLYYLRFLGSAPLVLGRLARSLKTRVTPEAAPVLREVPAGQPAIAIENSSARSASAAAGSQLNSQTRMPPRS